MGEASLLNVKLVTGKVWVGCVDQKGLYILDLVLKRLTLIDAYCH